MRPPCGHAALRLVLRAVRVVHMWTSRLGVLCGARIRRAVDTTGSVRPPGREVVLLAYSAVAGAVACGRQRLVSLVAPRACAQRARQQLVSRCRPDGARQCDHTDQPVRPPLGRWHGRALHTAHSAACCASNGRRAMCRRLGFNYLTGTVPAELYSLFTTGKEWWTRYERPPPLSRPDEVAATCVAAAGRSSTRRSTAFRASFVSLAPQT